MNVFISSLIRDMGPFRAAARRSVEALGHRPLLAEDFGAVAGSPQIVCLTGLRQADVVVLVLGEAYGAKQPSGLSATHEEYREARGKKPVLAFVQRGIHPDADQAELIAEVQGWESGLFRSEFSTPEDLGAGITRAVHEWELARAVGPLEPAELLKRALALLPVASRNSYSGNVLYLGLAAGPTQAILRPAEAEDPDFAKALLQAALFGPQSIFDAGKGTKSHLEGNALVLQQEGRNRNGAVLSVSEQGDIRMGLPLAESGSALPVIIEEDVRQVLGAALAFGGWVYDKIDPTHRLTHVALAAQLTAGGYFGWRTRNEHAASPQSIQTHLGNDDPAVVHLSPPHRARAALTHDATRLSDDLLVLLRRKWKG